MEDLAPAFAPGPAGGLVSASRGIVYAHERDGSDPRRLRAAEAQRLRQPRLAARRLSGAAPTNVLRPGGEAAGGRLYDRASMAARKVFRWLAPLALVAVIAAVYLVVHKTLAPKHKAVRPATSHQTVRMGTKKTGRPRPADPRGATSSSPGDSLSSIAVKIKLSVASLERSQPQGEPQRAADRAASRAPAVRGRVLTVAGTRPPLQSAALAGGGRRARRLPRRARRGHRLCVPGGCTAQARAVSPPSVDATAAVLFDADTGQTLWGKQRARAGGDRQHDKADDRAASRSSTRA